MRGRRARAARLVAALALTVPLVGCSSGGPTLDGPLPPVEPRALTELYEDELAEHGVRITDRGGLIDRGSGYDASAEGTHLALYLAPVGDRDEEAYVEGVVALTALFAQDVFERWPELESFDVCQEQEPSDVEDEGGEQAPTLSQVELSRSTAAAIDWETTELADLLATVEDDEDSFVRTFPPLDEHPRVVAAAEEAGVAEDERVWDS